LETRFQLCGTLALRLHGRRVERDLPGRLGRLLVVYLAVSRARDVPREELGSALWPDTDGEEAEARLTPLLSKTRRVLGHEVLTGRAAVRLELPADGWIDLEAAGEALHRAEAAFGRGDWTGVYGPGRVAQHIAVRGFLPGEDADWARDVRRRLEETYARALELVGAACLHIGPAELDTAERCARSLIRQAPYRESGYRLLMDIHVRRGNRGEALLVYDTLRRKLDDELGTPPSAQTRALHRLMLDEPS
jgi:DNA-binding SARP family transcriptional activator